ncbi:MAG: DUF2796 domain-containing protein [Variovorax sp.]|nr:MAG: DUF2796 domain-containing protein [Variovorax sp.]
MSLFRNLSIAALCLGLAGVAGAQKHNHQHAHVHGQMELTVAVDGPRLVIELASPLDSIVGFERAPKNDAEKKTVESALAKLRAADQLFAIDPAARCKAGDVDLRSAALGVGKAEPEAQAGHADLDATFTFECGDAAAARYIDVALFTAFKGARQIDAQIATSQGQFKRNLKRPTARLAWGK